MDENSIIEILLIEDNPNDEELTLLALGRYKFANPVRVLRDGEEALDFLFCRGKYAQRRIGDTPKLILLDLKLPKIDGLEVLRELKADERTRAIPVVMLTSSNQDSDIVKSYGLGVNSYIVKPVDFDRFSETIKQLGYYWLVLNEPPD